MTPPPNTTITRPTPLAERTLIGALSGLCLLALFFGGDLLFLNWPDTVAEARVHYLGIALIIAMVGIVVMIAAFSSPWLGSVRVSGMGAQLDIQGETNHE